MVKTTGPEQIQAIPGGISSAELFSEAVRTNKKIKYYVLSKLRSGDAPKILIRYVTPSGNITNGKGRRYTGFKHGVPRFINYWHAYAYRLILQQEEV